MRRSVLIVAGDRSGDRHAARLATALKTLTPDLEVAALGGRELEGVADRFLGSLIDLGVFGFWRPLTRFPALVQMMRSVIDPFLHSHRPDVVIPVDYYGFNIHVAEHAHRCGIPVVYYISPQVWASRPGRIKRLAQVVRRMLVIFPFEEPLYRRHGVEVSFVGHPLLDLLPEPLSPPTESTPPLLGLLPGSRTSEIRRHLPVLLKAAAQLKRRLGDLTVQVFYESSYECRRRLTAALTCSGTATLENALLGVPMVVMYRLSWFNYLITRALIQSPFIAMPNVLANRPLVPELIQRRATATALADTVYPLLTDLGYREAVRKELLTLRKLLGAQGASHRAAQQVLEVIA
ncbi:MAG: hypothetical protein HYZ73_04595 [Elusimicrobia bacterium]|nr:hypothetical protein [Elusimicrobiota bacterium]